MPLPTVAGAPWCLFPQLLELLVVGYNTSNRLSMNCPSGGDKGRIEGVSQPISSFQRLSMASRFGENLISVTNAVFFMMLDSLLAGVLLTLRLSAWL